jgi:hypothetical protein
MLSNFDIEDMAKDADLDLIGVFSKDQMPKERVAGCYIINLQNSGDGDGTHWICCKIFANGKACYFDSFGMPMPIEINSFLMKLKPVATNNREIQDLKSDKCGYFCLAFCYYFNNFDPYKADVFNAYQKLLDHYAQDTKQNDKIVDELIKRYKD